MSEQLQSYKIQPQNHRKRQHRHPLTHISMTAHFLGLILTIVSLLSTFTIFSQLNLCILRLLSIYHAIIHNYIVCISRYMTYYYYLSRIYIYLLLIATHI